MANGNLTPSIGDVVNLISGGPPMTVEKLENAPVPSSGLPPGVSPQVLVYCVWFNSAGAFAHGVFNAAVLVASSAATPTAPPSPQ